MNSLVLGGNGFIGSHLVDQLLKLGHKVRVFDQHPRINQINLKKIDYQSGNFNDEQSVKAALQGIEIVYHLISTTVPSTSNLNPMADVQCNLIGTIRLLESMRNHNICKIVYFSSGGTIYGNSTELKISEEHSQNPICSYGIVKLSIEKYLLMYKELYSIEPLILRISNPYGPGQRNCEVQGLIGAFLRNITEGKSIEIWGNGEVVRDYIYISDVIDACELAIEKNLSGIFNIGTGKGYSVNQVIDLIKKVYPSKFNISYKEKRNFDVERAVLDIQKANMIIGWRPKVTLEFGLIKYIEWLQSL